MTDRDFEINGIRFKLNKINAIKQFHIVRRLGPLLGEFMGAASKASKLGIEEIGPEQFEIFIPVIEGLSKLSDSDSEYVLYGLLSSVEMQQKQGNWAYIANDKVLLFHDLELPILLQVAARAFGFNLKGFLAVSSQVSRA